MYAILHCTCPLKSRDNKLVFSKTGSVVEYSYDIWPLALCKQTGPFIHHRLNVLSEVRASQLAQALARVFNPVVKLVLENQPFLMSYLFETKSQRCHWLL